MNQFKTILKFEYFGYVRTKAFIITTVLFFVIVAAASSLPMFINAFNSIRGDADISAASDDEPSMNALIASPSAIFTDEVLSAYLPGYMWTRADNIDNAWEAIESGDYDLALRIDGLNYTAYERTTSLITQGSQHAINFMIKDVYQREFLDGRGFAADEIDHVLHSHPIGEIIVVGTDYTQTFWIGYVMMILMFFAMILYGQFVSTSVVVEKSSKAMELLITSAKPFQLMMGKVLGVGMAGLTQFGAILLAAFVFIRLNQASWNDFNPAVAAIMEMSMSGSLILLALLFFLFSFFSYAFVLAGFACTASRMEELQTIALIPTLIAVATFYVAIAGSMMPDAAYVKICSFIPMLSPMLMFMRICIADVPIAEIIAACAINAAAIFAFAFVCSRIYKVGVMLYGKKPRVKDILRYAFKS
ncbi:MAG: ABC transporter permease [Defluviitaleaceae bacterium]|nr:ABC transporter permease [Defluviitaleaceae bacterium]MCL2836480.1 ABC transporter permease [Defluviitaleaceae bacterium]